jgi:heme exporter protein B
LLLATPLLSLLGAVCVVLTVGMHRSGMLVALLVLPLYVPVLIFGAGACNAAQAGLPFIAVRRWRWCSRRWRARRRCGFR